MTKLTVFLRTHTLRFPRGMAGWTHALHNLAHCTYLGAVFVEAHGFYGKAAGALLLLVVVSIFLHVDEGME